MKSRARALLDKSIGAMISAIEVYNKPSFRYREETFSVLAINAWELLLKAKKTVFSAETEAELERQGWHRQ